VDHEWDYVTVDEDKRGAARAHCDCVAGRAGATRPPTPVGCPVHRALGFTHG